MNQITDFHITEAGNMECTSLNGRLVISFLSSQTLYVRCDFKGLAVPAALEQANRTLKGNPAPSAQRPVLKVTETNATAALGSISVTVSSANGNIKVMHEGKTIFGGQIGTQDTVMPLTQIRAFRKTGDDSWHARINEPLKENDRFFGLGDKSGVPDRRNRRVRMFNRDSLGYDAQTSDPMYKAIAFYIKQNPANGTIAGFYYPEALINALDFGEESPFYSYVEISEGPIAFYIMAGDTYDDIVRSYCSITGFPALPPLFSFGFFGSSMNYVESDDAMQRILKYFRATEETKIPCEGMYVSSGYLKADDGKRYAFFWNKRKFPDHGKFLRDLRERGYNLGMNIKPGFLVAHPWYKTLRDKGYFLKDADGNPLVEFYWGGDASFLDFLNPEAKRWWKDQLKDKYLSHGCTGIWNDNNECELEDPDTDSYRTKLLYPLLMCQAAWEACNEYDSGKRHWIYTRSACPGTQRFARTWTGDNTSTWKTLRYNQYQLLSLGLSAFPYAGNDLGGFFGERPSLELLVRSCQSAVFQPRFVIHSWRADDKPTEPWTYPEALDMIRDLVLEHYRFMPYIYTAAYEASRTGKPINRIIALEYSDDRDIPTDLACYQCGPSIISLFTVDEGQDTTSLRLPAGTSWYDPYSGKLIHGGEETSFKIPLGKARYIFKSPSVIPTSDGCCSLTTGHFKSLCFNLIPGVSEYEYTYFEDDGSSSLSQGEFCLISVKLQQNKASFEILKGTLPLAGRRITSRLPDGFSFNDGSQEKELDLSSGKTVLSFQGKFMA